jgi:hypothetical protein
MSTNQATMIVVSDEATAETKCVYTAGAAFVHYTFGAVLLFTWIVGMVIAKGFWSTLCSLCPLWAYYLVVEKGLIYLDTLCKF